MMLALLLAALTLTGAEEILKNHVTGKPVRYGGNFDTKRVVTVPPYRQRAREMRGIWVTTVQNIDFSQHADMASFKRDFINLVNNLQRAKFNAIFFQIRPMCDAFYPSKHNPWSRYLAGAEGKMIPNFDPLAFMVNEAHKRGIEFHAWLNPYRVNGAAPAPKANYLKTLSNQNFAKKNPKLVLELKLPNNRYSLFLNPGEPLVVKHITDTVAEIINQYPIDAIHFDDYFYLYEDIGSIDSNSFKRNNPHQLSLGDWRRNNVSTAIYSVKQTILAFNRRTGRKVAFGISPFGIWANKKNNPYGSLTGGKQSFYTQFADTRTWVKKGWVDYIIPQIYWPFSHDTAAYAALAEWWSMTVSGTRVRLFIGQGLYRVGTESAWQAREIIDQMRFNQKFFNIDGTVFFSYRNFFTPANAKMKETVSLLRNNCWRYPAGRPGYPNVK